MPSDLTSWLRQQIERLSRKEPDPGDIPPKDEPPEFKYMSPRFEPWDGPTALDRELSGISVEEARAYLRREIAAYLAMQAPDYGLLIRAAPGLGKTTIGVAAAQAWVKIAKGRRTLYAGPRHAFYADILGTRDVEPAVWYEWQPRQTGDQEQGKIETCPHAESITQWLNRGYDAIGYCQQVCGWDCVKNDCVYHAQKRQTEPIIFGMHQHVSIAHPMEFDLVIGDESPMGAFVNEWHIPSSHVVPKDADLVDTFTHMMADIEKLASSGQRLWGKALIDVLGGADAVINATAKHRELVSPTPQIHRPEDVESVGYQHAQPLAQLLYREAHYLQQAGQESVSRVSVVNDKLTLLLRRPPNKKLPSHVIWLDATANPRLYQACFGRAWKVLEPFPAMRGRFWQVRDRMNSKGSLIDGKGEEVAAKVHVGQTEQMLRKLIDGRGYKQPAAISYQAMERVSVVIRELSHGHFYAARGTNEFEECDALFVIGTPMPSGQDMLRTAAAIFHERDRPFSDAWHFVSKPYAWKDEAGQAWSYSTLGYWNDPDLQAVLQSLREDEIVQAAHRVRPLHREVDVWLMTNLPTIDLPLAGLLTMRDVMGAPEEVDVWLWGKALAEAQRIDEANGYVTAPDLVEALKISKPTANKYIAKLIAEEGWESVQTARSAANKRGPLPRAARMEKL